MQKTYAKDIAGHRLRREIIATVLANEVINRGGPGFVVNLAENAGVAPTEVVRAAMLAREGFDFARLWNEADKLDGQVSGEAQNSFYAEIGAVFADLTRLLVKSGTAGQSMQDASQKLAQAVKTLKPSLRTIMPADLAGEISETEAGFVSAGIPPQLAAEVAELRALLIIPEIMQICERTGDSLTRASEIYMSASQRFHVGRLLSAAAHVTAADAYEGMALTRARDQIAAARQQIVIGALTHHRRDKAPLDAWLQSDTARTARLSAELKAVSDSGEPTVAKLTVAAGLLADLALV